MGAIAGIIYPDVFDHTRQLDPMIGSLKHRGCDFPKTHVFRNVQVGCCGCHLFVDEKKNIVIGLDGEIHNKPFLINILKKEGYSFQKEDCSEVIAASYHFWKQEFLKKIRGEFSFFIFDSKQEILLLARDPLGKKPLYWYLQNNLFLFGSELKALLASGLVPPSPSNQALGAYLFLGYTPQDLSPIENVNKLLPGYYLTLKMDHTLSILPYWSYSSFFTQEKKIDSEEAEKTVVSLLNSAISDRLPKNEPIGAFISGGLGSASIAYFLKKQMQDQSLTGFTVGFIDEYEEDIRTAEEITKALHIPHEKKIIHPENFLKDLVSIVWYLDEPIADPNIVATWNLAKLAKTYTKTVFSGMGSDELLAGHSRYILPLQDSLFRKCYQNALRGFRSLLLPLLLQIDRKFAFSMAKIMRTNPWQYEYLKQNALFEKDMLKSASKTLAHSFDPRVFLNKFYHISRVPSTVSSLLYFDVKTRLADHFSLQYERLTSAHGLSWETPYLDLRIVEFLASLFLPDSIQEMETPRFLKKILSSSFPPSVVQRPKKSRKDFLKSWAKMAPLKDAFSLLIHGVLVDTGIISKEWLQKQIATPEQICESFRYLWSILILEIWFRLYIQKPFEEKDLNLSLHDFLKE